MTDSKRVVCLANSRKLTGRCIAGREIGRGKPGAWIRPVSARASREVSEYERQYEDGSDPRVLDIISIPVLKPLPEKWQTENWLLDDEFYWRKEGTWPRFDLSDLLDPVTPLWINGFHTYHGNNDKIPDESMRDVSGSLRLIHAIDSNSALPCSVPVRRSAIARRSVGYRSSYEAYLAKLDGTTTWRLLPDISLGEPYQGACYKLVAAIIECVASMTSPRVLTIGHSNHPLERFLALLSKHGVTAVADVRWTPYSRF